MQLIVKPKQGVDTSQFPILGEDFGTKNDVLSKDDAMYRGVLWKAF